jgi:oligoribonuclease (3'-5' exoribonuclease)
MTAHPEPIYSARDQGFREALLQVLSFIAKHGKAEVDAFCAQALHDLRMDTLHWNAAKDAEIAKLQEIVRTQAEEAAKATYYYTDKMDEMKKECDALAGALERILDGGYVSEQIEEERFDYLTARAALAKHKGEA